MLSAVQRVAQLTGNWSLCAREQTGAIKCGLWWEKVTAKPGISASNVAAAYDHVCVVLKTGTLHCWKEPEAVNQWPPLEFTKVRDAVSISLGYGEACAVLKTGSILCTTPRQPENGEPTLNDQERERLPRIKSMSMSIYSSWAQGEDGTVWCIGRASKGECGNGSLEASTSVHQVPIADVVSISSAASQACAVRNDHTLWCWGYPGGATPNAIPATERLHSATPRRFNDLSDIREFSMSDHHSCAAFLDGGVSCWGSAVYGQLGTIAAGAQSVPAPVRW